LIDRKESHPVKILAAANPETITGGVDETWSNFIQVYVE